jgi:predicted histone-like DNA-binding protein
MSKINYALVQRRNPLKKDAPKLFYATAQKSGDLTFNELKDQIAHATMATKADVSHIVESLLKVMGDGLKAGKSIFLDQFGKFRLVFSSKGVPAMKDFSTELIRNIHIVFRPCRDLKISRNELTFEQKTTVKEQKETLRAQLKESKPVTPTKPETKPDTNPSGTGGKNDDSDLVG